MVIEIVAVSKLNYTIGNGVGYANSLLPHKTLWRRAACTSKKF